MHAYFNIDILKKVIFSLHPHPRDFVLININVFQL